MAFFADGQRVAVFACLGVSAVHHPGLHAVILIRCRGKDDLISFRAFVSAPEWFTVQGSAQTSAGVFAAADILRTESHLAVWLLRKDSGHLYICFQGKSQRILFQAIFRNRDSVHLPAGKLHAGVRCGGKCDLSAASHTGSV